MEFVTQLEDMLWVGATDLLISHRGEGRPELPRRRISDQHEQRSFSLLRMREQLTQAWKTIREQNAEMARLKLENEGLKSRLTL